MGEVRNVADMTAQDHVMNLPRVIRKETTEPTPPPHPTLSGVAKPDLCWVYCLQSSRPPADNQHAHWDSVEFWRFLFIPEFLKLGQHLIFCK